MISARASDKYEIIRMIQGIDKSENPTRQTACPLQPL